MICYEKDGSIIFSVAKPKTGSILYELAASTKSNGNEFYKPQIKNDYNEFEDYISPDVLHGRFHDTLNQTGYYKYKRMKLDFKNHIAYLDEYVNGKKSGNVTCFSLLYPNITEFCIKGSVNNFVYGKNSPINEDCNLFNMLRNDKEALKELKNIIRNSNPDYAKMIITELWPELAKFYFEILPEIELEEIYRFKEKALKQSLNLDPCSKEILQLQPIANTNAKILKLLPQNN